MDDGIHCFTTTGELIGKILVPEQRTANCTFGDPDRKTLYIRGDVSLDLVPALCRGRVTSTDSQ